MTDLEQYLEEQVEDMGLDYVGDVKEKEGDYLLTVQVMNHQQVNFDNSIFTVHHVDYQQEVGCYLRIKVQASFVKFCIDKITPLN